MTERANRAEIPVASSPGLRLSRGARMAGAVFIALILLVFLGPLVWNVDPASIDVMSRNQGPSAAHPFGTDQLGRDTLARVLAGGRISLAVGLTAMVLAVGLGTVIGLVAGYFQFLDGPLMRLTDFCLCLPLLPLLLVLVTLFRDALSDAMGPEAGLFALIVIAVGATSWMQTARLVRAEVLGLRTREFVLAARSVGTRDSQLLSRHILPNAMSPIFVSATLGVANAILTESTLSFLGLGFPPDFPTWGRLLADATVYITDHPERAFWPALAISLTLLSVNSLGEGLREALDPRAQRR